MKWSCSCHLFSGTSLFDDLLAEWIKVFSQRAVVVTTFGSRQGRKARDCSSGQKSCFTSTFTPGGPLLEGKELLSLSQEG